MPRLLQLDGSSLEELKARVLAEHGTRAKVIAVESVTTGGIKGFFGTRHYEVTVELPDLPTPNQLREAHTLDVPARIGMAALLDDADVEEAVVYNQVSNGFPVSTSSREFANIMDQLESVTIPPVVEQRAQKPAPPPLSAPGDLVVIVGLGTDALAVAHAMATNAGMAEVAVAGALETGGRSRIEDRRASTIARAHGVERGEAVFIAFGLRTGAGAASAQTKVLTNLHADQVWVVVDAALKPEDTAVWIEAVTASVRIDAVAATNRESTVSPETVAELGLPVSWAYTG